MNSSHFPINFKKTAKVFTENIYLISLVLIIVILSILGDIFTRNSYLTIPLIISISLSYFISKLGIPILRNIKFHQTIKREGPKNHIQKSGTPTMGGILIIPIGLLVGNFFYLDYISKSQIIAISYLTISYMFIGIFDDWKGLSRNTNKGLSGKAKIFLQIIASLLFLYWAFINGWINPNINLFFSLSFDFGMMIWPFSLFVLLAESNATNLTDGLDGLASGCGALVFTGLALHLNLSEQINNHALASFCIGMAGVWIGFLFHNKNPAKVFMGDTGSLAMGATLSGVALITNNLWALLLMGGIFLAESLSVIFQVSFFKISKKLYGKGRRIFLMAPLHHHFELQGVKEETIVNQFWLITLCLVGVSFLLRTS